MATDIDICNSALSKLGVDHIVSLEDDSRQAKLCKEQYPKLKKSFLRAHPWNFAIERATLAASATAPVHGFDYQYRLPISCLRVLSVNENIYPWVKEGDYILSDSDECDIVYLADVAEGKFDAISAEVLSIWLAADLAADLNPNEKQTLLQQKEIEMRAARSFDAQESFVGRVQTRTFISSRR